MMKLVSVHDRDDLKRNICATNRIKSRNESLLYTVDALNKAITSKRKVFFSTTTIHQKRKKLRNGVEIYTLSPYAIFWNDDFNYVVGYSDKHDNVSTFRAERICHLEMVDEKAVEKLKGFSLDRYSRQIFEIIVNDIDMYIEARWTRSTFRVFLMILVRNTNLLYNLNYKVNIQGYPYMI